MRGTLTIDLHTFSNVFMTVAVYGHLCSKDHPSLAKRLFRGIPVSWGIAFAYCPQVPADRSGHVQHGGPCSLVQLTMVQEVITLVVFSLFSLIAYRQDPSRLNHALAGLFLVAIGWLAFRK